MRHAIRPDLRYVMLKLTGGDHKGRALKWLDTPTIRPTPARVREAVFNIFAREIEGSRWWDLCCGSGVVGLEALSRGAAHVTFVDQNQRSLQLLKTNLQTLGLQDRARVVCLDAVRWLKLQPALAAGFIYCDPPYDSRIYQPLLTSLGELPLTQPVTTLLLEHRKRDTPWQDLGSWNQIESRAYGDTRVAILERCRT